MSRDALISPADVTLFSRGVHHRLGKVLGCQFLSGRVRFALWAPHAAAVSVIGDFNGWSSGAHPLLRRVDGSGVWEAYVRGVAPGAFYKYHIVAGDGGVTDEADPLAFASEGHPGGASRAWRFDYVWGDGAWMAARREQQMRAAQEPPLSIYQLHPGGWRRTAAGTRPNFRDLAAPLAEYVVESAFTHVELLGFDGTPENRESGGSTCFAPPGRYGSPDDFMFLVDTLHRAGIGVFLEWGVACADGHELLTGGGALPEVRALLISSALFWLEHYHIDGLRVAGQLRMVPPDPASSADGGSESREAVAFLRCLNETLRKEVPDACTIAEHSSASTTMLTRPVPLGGLGFALAWNSEWTRTTLDYFRHDPLYRKFHHDRLSASLSRACAENFVLPLAYDAISSGQGSLLSQMPGDEWQGFAGLRCLYGYMWAHPGKKLLFMGGEFGQFGERGQRLAGQDGELDWAALARPGPGGLRRWVGDLNRLYREQPALHAQDFQASGCVLIDASDRDNSVLSLLRCAPGCRPLLIVCNFTPVLRTNYVVGVPGSGRWHEALNSDALIYGGSGAGNFGAADAMPVPAQGQAQSLALTLPPHGVLYLVGQDNPREDLHDDQSVP